MRPNAIIASEIGPTTRPLAAVLSEPELEAEGVYAVQVVLDEPLVLAETELGVEVQRPAVGHFGLEHHLQNRSAAAPRQSFIGYGRSGGIR